MDAAVADIPDGVTIFSPGFGGVGVPRNLLAALNRQGAKGLTAVSNNAGTVDELVDIGTLVEAGQIKKMICVFLLNEKIFLSQQSQTGAGALILHMIV